jgi:hypothetical protein
MAFCIRKHKFKNASSLVKIHWFVYWNKLLDKPIFQEERFDPTKWQQGGH